jgi:hypothetical protein
MAEAAQRVLMNEFKQLSKEKWTNIEVSLSEYTQGGGRHFSGGHMQSTQLTAGQLINDNVFEWSVALIVLNEDSLYYGGYFKAKMTFPRNYPHSPPGTSHTALNSEGPDESGRGAPPDEMLTMHQTSSSSDRYTTPTSTPTAASASPSCTHLAMTRCPARQPPSAGPLCSASRPC